MRHGLELTGITLLSLAGLNIRRDCLSRGGLWVCLADGNFYHFAERTVPVHACAIRAVQGDFETVYHPQAAQWQIEPKVAVIPTLSSIVTPRIVFMTTTKYIRRQIWCLDNFQHLVMICTTSTYDKPRQNATKHLTYGAVMPWGRFPCYRPFVMCHSMFVWTNI